MQVIDSSFEVRITYSMTLEEARFLQRICDGYVGLPRFLATVSARFPEKEAALERIVHGLHTGVSHHIDRAEQSQRVFAGVDVAVNARELERLQADAAEMRKLRADLHADAIVKQKTRRAREG